MFPGIRAALLSLVVGVAALTGCAPAIGDSCQVSTDCSFNGDRLCDPSYPGGYCTTFGCDRDTCADDAVCVEFRFATPRLAESNCMAACDSDGDCRDEYRCSAAGEVRDGDTVLAQVLDSRDRRFCVPRNR